MNLLLDLEKSEIHKTVGEASLLFKNRHYIVSSLDGKRKGGR